MDELMYCPFCGREGSLIVEQRDEDFFVICHNADNGCLACGPVAGSEEEAIKLWNRRRTRSRLQEILEARNG